MQDQQSYSQGGRKRPLISFIVTSYNMPVELLKECIESIVALNLRPDEREIIVVDDGSQTSPIDSLGDLRTEIVYIRQKNEGLSVARNNGMRISTGRYMQFVDGDDRLLKDAYDMCLAILKDQQPDMLLFHLTTKDKSSTSTVNAEEAVSGAAYMHNNNLRASACGYIFSRMTLSTLQFTPGLLHEDEEFTPLLLLRTERLISTDAQAYYYRYRPQSITTAKGPRIQLRRLNDLKDIIGRLHHQAAMMPHNETQHHAQRLADTERILFKLQDIASKLPEFERVALSRRIAQLTMDYLYQVMKIGHGNNMLDETIERLRAKGLFPLPDKGYTKKYSLFRMMTNSGAGRKFLQTVIR